MNQITSLPRTIIDYIGLSYYLSTPKIDLNLMIIIMFENHYNKSDVIKRLILDKLIIAAKSGLQNCVLHYQEARNNPFEYWMFYLFHKSDPYFQQFTIEPSGLSYEYTIEYS